MSVTVQEWPPLEIKPKENLPDYYIGLLDWVLDESTVAVEEGLVAEEEHHEEHHEEQHEEQHEEKHKKLPSAGSARNESNAQDVNEETRPEITQPVGASSPFDPQNFNAGGSRKGSDKSNSPVEEPREDQPPTKSPKTAPQSKSVSSFHTAKEKAMVQPAAGWTAAEEAVQDPDQTAPVENGTPLKNGTVSSWDVSAPAEAPDTPEFQEASNGQEADEESQVGELPPKTEDHTQSTRPRSLSVAAWVIDTEEAPVSTVLAVPKTKNSSSHCCEIDPMTGDLLPAIEHPETRLAHDVDLRSEPGWRRGHMTSDMQINRELRVRAKLAELLKVNRALQPEVSPSPVEEQSFFPKADCKIRPAVESDVADIADIMNAEQRRKSSVESTHPSVFKKWDMQKIFLQCKKDQRPFIVATASEDELLDRANWPITADRAFRAYLKYRSAASQTKPPSIVGFAFAAPRQGSSLDSQEARTDHSCYVTLFVHPDYRNKKYGAALLDRILMSVSTVHRSLIDFDWECDEPAEVYEHPPSNNARQYSRVFVEYLDSHSEDKRLPSRQQLLEQFGFTQVGHLTCMKSEMRENKRCWLDLFMWQLEAQPLENVR